MLNALFPSAFNSAMKGVDLAYYHNIILFTDDEVMASVRRLFLETNKKDNPDLVPARFAFLRNRLPKYLYVIDINEESNEDDIEMEIKTTLATLSKSFSIDEKDIVVERTESALIKEKAELPRVLRKIPQPNGESTIELLPQNYLASQWENQGRPTRVRQVHFFTQQFNFRGGRLVSEVKTNEPLGPDLVAKSSRRTARKRN